MNLSDILKKLKYETGHKALLIKAPPEYTESAAKFGIDTHMGAGKYDFVHLFVNNKEEVDKFGKQAVESGKYDGILWISFPNGNVKTDISIDYGWETITKMGMGPVSQMTIDENWSALRFRPTECVSKK